MTKFKEVLGYMALACFFAYMGFVAISIVMPPAYAQDTPSAGTYPYSVGISSTTVDSEILAAPGANYRWMVTGVSYSVLVEEADKLALIEDAAGTPINVLEFAPEVQGASSQFFYGEGLPCSVNSAVQIDVSSTTADIWVSVTAYKQRVP